MREVKGINLKGQEEEGWGWGWGCVDLCAWGWR